MSQGLKYTFLIHAIIATVLGLAFFFIPRMSADLGNWPASDPNVTRIFGAAVLAIAVSSWAGYLAEAWAAVRIVVMMEIAYTVLGTLAGLYGVFFDEAPNTTWIFIVIFVLFAIAWIYFYSKAPKEAAG